jgi:hypothetical protein
MRRALLTVVLVALILADLSFVPFAVLLMLVGGLQALLGLSGHPSAGASRPQFLLGAAVFFGAGVLIAAALLWLTRSVLRMRRAA